ncbi:YqeG family HAD IIIA-type phosphatase [Facklamia miroungae]|uniref:YqeG family HAD IIIA-type phosphatase n=1 Tax=Facklamia miroungae TaxID=120956 RepID=A0A1G7UIP1_9LACT|nr:YqeG family HAD IIIA-type phosphatase [Facklamia miroungae]NKZ30086.1 YqeG family HAD IIIA-type phosphatase [Facklamia miroungae]SDG47422.1 hypothetical protein SAMN05421791_11035 [Facklamia miroungae]
MKNLIQPTWCLNSIYRLTPSDLMNQQIKGLIVDLDNTLLAWNCLDHTQELALWVTSMKEAGIKLFVLSNNHPERVHRVANPLKIPYLGHALKPLRRSFQLAMKAMQVDPENVLVVGDQIMTDVIGARSLGLKVLLVKPIVNNDNIYTLVNRNLEKMALKWIGIDRHGDWGDQLERSE